jgi:hypothetical protein
MRLLPNRNVTVHSWDMWLLTIAASDEGVHSLRAIVGQDAAMFRMGHSWQNRGRTKVRIGRK